jgi:ubiquinone/menaquinone biosynthesis C-methylase UbiE
MSESAQSFGAVAPYYDELMKPVPYRMWVGYYMLLLAQQEVKPRKILDVACGTGTMCQMLAAEQYQVTGFDLSAPMIEEARLKARRRHLEIRYEVADARDFDLGDTFEGAYSFFDSLNNLTDPADLFLAIQRVAAHLPQGGSFIFDLNTAYAFEAKLFDQKNLRKNSKLQYDWVGNYDPATQIIEVDMKFWYQGEFFQELHRQRAYGEEEVREMLQEAGFGQIRAYESYSLNPPRFKSDRLHYSAIRE